MKYLLWLCAIWGCQLSAEEGFVAEEELVKQERNNGINKIWRDMSSVDYRLSTHFKRVFEPGRITKEKERYRMAVGPNLEKVDVLKMMDSAFLSTISMSGEMVPFRQSCIQLPKFLCDFYETIRERAYRNGFLLRQHLSPGSKKCLDLCTEVNMIPEVGVLFDMKFLRLFDRHYEPLLDQWKKEVERLRPYCHNNVFVGTVEAPPYGLDEFDPLYPEIAAIKEKEMVGSSGKEVAALLAGIEAILNGDAPMAGEEIEPEPVNDDLADKMKRCRRIPDQYSSLSTWGDTMLPDNCMGASPQQNLCVALFRLADFVRTIADANASDVLQMNAARIWPPKLSACFHFSSIGKHPFFHIVLGNLVFLIERRLPRFATLPPRHKLAEE